MVWQEPQNHLNDCYFCAVKTTGFTSKTRSLVEHPSLPSAIEPVPHSVELSILGLPYRPEFRVKFCVREDFLKMLKCPEFYDGRFGGIIIAGIIL